MFSTGLPKRFPEENIFFYPVDEIIFKEAIFSMNPRCSWLPLYGNVKRDHADK